LDEAARHQVIETASTMMNGTLVSMNSSVMEMGTRVPAVQEASSPVGSHACGTWQPQWGL